MNKCGPSNARDASVIGVVGRYAIYRHISSAEIAGTPGTLRDLAQGIRARGRGGVLRLREMKDASPAPYEGFLKELAVVVGTGPVRIYREQERLVVAGLPDSLDAVAELIEDLAGQGYGDGPVPNHVHVEYWPDHPFLHPDAEPLVVSVTQGDAE